MKHPLDFIPPDSRKRIFFALLILTLVLVAVFRILDTPLRNPVAASGIVSFELAGTPEKAQAVIDSWDARAREYAAFGLGLDYLFMLAYALTLSLGVLLAAEKHGGKFAALGIRLGWGVLAAAIFDAVENVALWRLLSGAATPLCPRLAAFSASFKFALLLLGLGYALIGWLWPKR
ncbi:MAG: hypothetical protein GXP40_05905 [Chloroflexi bacterium]|nr:hypothetical protein [Chloroflexota bacterium]